MNLAASAFGRLVLVFLALMLVWEAALGVTTYVRLRSDLETDLARRLVASAQLLSLGIDGALVSQFGRGDEALPVYRLAADRLAAQASAAGVERAYVIDQTQHTLLDSAATSTVGEFRYSVLANRAEVERAFAGQPTPTRLYLDDAGQWRLSAFAPVRRNGGVAAVVGIDASPEYFASLQQLQRQMLWFGALSLVVAALVGSFFLRNVSRRLDRLRQSISQVARGDFDVSIERGGGDEIDALGRDLDGLVASLLRRRDYYESVLGGLSVGLLTVDTEGMITGANHAAHAITGISALVGRPAEDALVKQPALVAFVQRCRASHAPDSSEITLHVDENEPARQIAVVCSPILQAETPVGSTVWLSDVTQMRTLERRARTNERLAALGSMAAGLLHEIRNPLASLVTYLELARGAAHRIPNEEAERELHDVLERAQVQGERLAHFLQDFQIVAGLRPLRLERVEVAALVARVLDSVDRPPNIEIDGAIDPTTAVRADRRLLEHALRNLVQNAFEALQTSGGRIAVVVTARDGHVRVDVRDNGPGIAPHLVDRVFDPMMTTKPGGTGLGLTIVHRIIEAHQGTIDVTSAGGTIFHIVLPEAVDSRVLTGDYGAHPGR